jgi:hypothetical protein
MPFSTYLADSLLDHAFRGDAGATSFTQPTTLYLALHSADPTGEALATELIGGSYARQSITFDPPDLSTHDIANTSEIVFTGLPSVPGGITHLSVWDAVTAGNMLMFDDYGTGVINDGDAVTIAIGAITLRLLYLE